MSELALGQLRILVVDDEAANVQLMLRTLARAGYLEVRAVTDAREVLDLVSEWSPDLVMLDLHMPHIDGATLLAMMRERLGASDFIPVIVLTADASQEALVKAMSAGANDFLTKPLNLEEVLLRVRNLLVLRLSHEELRNSNAGLATTLRRHLQFDQSENSENDERAKVIRAAIDNGPNIVFQPIVQLSNGVIVGFEALSRFESAGPVDRWFADAFELGLGVDLELAAIEAALEKFDELLPHEFMSLNASPTLMYEPRFRKLLQRRDTTRLVVEITEHQPVSDYDELGVIRRELQSEGVRLAIDDAGAGYASLRHILMLSPDIIKFDIALTRDVDSDRVKRALATSLLEFAREIGAAVTAEGVESRAELQCLKELGVDWAQGFYLAMPTPIESAQRHVTAASTKSTR